MNDIELIEYAIGIDKFVKTKQLIETSSKYIKYNLKRNKPLQGTDKALVNLCAVLKLIGMKFDLLKIRICLFALCTSCRRLYLGSCYCFARKCLLPDGLPLLLSRNY